MSIYLITMVMIMSDLYTSYSVSLEINPFPFLSFTTHAMPHLLPCIILNHFFPLLPLVLEPLPT